jgi:multimeric flavodoxin WrbA
MNRPAKITAIVGTYRKKGVIDSAVDELLGAAAAAGAQVTKFHLVDEQIEFCNNCRSCTQQAGGEFGCCVINDRMRPILDEIERSDGIVLASPMDFGTVTAVKKRFIERLVCFAYWPWGKAAPSTRKRERAKRAVVVASSAAPAILARLFTSMVLLLNQAARLLGAKRVDVLFFGLAAMKDRPDLGDKVRRTAQRLGRRLAEHRCKRRAQKTGSRGYRIPPPFWLPDPAWAVSGDDRVESPRLRWENGWKL